MIYILLSSVRCILKGMKIQAFLIFKSLLQKFEFLPNTLINEIKYISLYLNFSLLKKLRTQLASLRNTGIQVSHFVPVSIFER